MFTNFNRVTSLIFYEISNQPSLWNREDRGVSLCHRLTRSTKVPEINWYFFYSLLLHHFTSASGPVPGPP